ncbi:glycosyltransferase [Desulfovibrio sp. OttesenSCG-928-A18]|nr:glycosyltransferase [Desulfovibrio sp. OttesenSCG-928-A18]
MTRARHSAQALHERGGFTDIIVRRGERSFHMLGPAGPERELRILPPEQEFPPAPPAQADEAAKAGAPDSFPPQSVLPVLVGSGTGLALGELVRRLKAAHGPDFMLAVADKEKDIQDTSRVRQEYASCPGIIWIDDESPEQALKRLSRWQTAQGGKPLLPLLNPFYLRLDRPWYDALRQACDDSARVDFWSRADYPRFAGGKARILLLTSQYFLMGEIVAACRRLDLPHHLLQIPSGDMGSNAFVKELLEAVLSFRPDFVFTINHLGVDREGVLVSLLEKLRLPLASWFVDNPHLILYLYQRLVNPWTAIFTWDADNLESLRDLGFAHVQYLPLGVDPTRFSPCFGQPAAPAPASAARNAAPYAAPDAAQFARFSQSARARLGLAPAWDGRISFVGNSMRYKVAERLRKTRLPAPLLQSYQQVAAGFAASNERSVAGYLRSARPDLARAFDAVTDVEQRLNYETLVTWESTLRYRLSCIRGILPLRPLIAGDKGWRELLPEDDSWLYKSELSYYDELPLFYPLAQINFNCTSKQMKGAVNQRVFDVPATGAFLLTDYREQVEKLFEPGREIICYRTPEEALALAGEYLERPAQREAVAKAARRRILNEHSYDHRILALADSMRRIYG